MPEARDGRWDSGWREEPAWRAGFVEAVGDVAEVAMDVLARVAGPLTEAAAVARRSARRERAIERLCFGARAAGRAWRAAPVAADERRVARPSTRAAVSATNQRQAAASGGSVSPETSASTSWLPFSDQFHKK